MRSAGNDRPTLPAQLRRSLNLGQELEMAQHAQLRIDTVPEIFFCDPLAPGQRAGRMKTPTVGLLRQYFPKRYYLSRHSR